MDKSVPNCLKFVAVLTEAFLNYLPLFKCIKDGFFKKKHTEFIAMEGIPDSFAVYLTDSGQGKDQSDNLPLMS